MITNILLEKVFGVIQNRRRTVSNKPLRKLHEKVVTDVVSTQIMFQNLTTNSGV